METDLKNVLDSVIVRFSGELWLKKHWTRRQYEKQLAKNLKKTLKQHNVPYSHLVRRHGRFYLKTGSAVEAAQCLTRVFGISSVSPALETSSKLDDVIDKSVLLAGYELEAGSSFAVRCKRVGNHSYSSADVRNLLVSGFLTSWVRN